MTIFNLYLFNRNGVLLHYNEWNRTKKSGVSKTEESKLIYGMLYSMKSLISKLSPFDFKDNFFSFRTNKYKCNYYETATGLKFILNTDVDAQNVRELMLKLYQNIYVEYVVKNPEIQPGQYIESELFRTKLDLFMKDVSCFNNNI